MHPPRPSQADKCGAVSAEQTPPRGDANSSLSPRKDVKVGSSAWVPSKRITRMVSPMQLD